MRMSRERMEQTLAQLETAISSCIQEWKRDNDETGYERFLQSLDLLEAMADAAAADGGSEPAKLVPLLTKLHAHVRNRDIVAIVDEFEWSLIPFVRDWRKVVTANAGNPG